MPHKEIIAVHPENHMNKIRMRGENAESFNLKQVSLNSVGDG
jgi:hypothetical protein